MRSLAAVALATSLMISNVYAATVSPLPVGKPAGVKHAQSEQNTMMLLIGVGIVGAGIALVASGDNGAPLTAPATTTTSTTTTTTHTSATTTTG